MAIACAGLGNARRGDRGLEYVGLLLGLGGLGERRFGGLEGENGVFEGGGGVAGG